MTIEQLLQSEDSHFRVSGADGDTWLVGDRKGGWIVYKHRRYARASQILIQTENLEEAIEVLINNE